MILGCSGIESSCCCCPFESPENEVTAVRRYIGSHDQSLSKAGAHVARTKRQCWTSGEAVSLNHSQPTASEGDSRAIMNHWPGRDLRWRVVEQAWRTVGRGSASLGCCLLPGAAARWTLWTLRTGIGPFAHSACLHDDVSTPQHFQPPVALPLRGRVQSEVVNDGQTVHALLC